MTLRRTATALLAWLLFVPASIVAETEPGTGTPPDAGMPPDGGVSPDAGAPPDAGTATGTATPQPGTFKGEKEWRLTVGGDGALLQPDNGTWAPGYQFDLELHQRFSFPFSWRFSLGAGLYPGNTQSDATSALDIDSILMGLGSLYYEFRWAGWAPSIHAGGAIILANWNRLSIGTNIGLRIDRPFKKVWRFGLAIEGAYLPIEFGESGQVVWIFWAGSRIARQF